MLPVAACCGSYANRGKTNMQLHHERTLMQAQPGTARTYAAAWSPNNKRLAVCDSGRIVNLFDELGERRDKFALRAADKRERTFVVAGMVFSPDSTKIAVAQDCIVHVYRIGIEWGNSKSICNRFVLQVPATAVVWPSGAQGNDQIVFGGQDGTVRAGTLHSNKAGVLYAHEAAVVSLASSADGNQVISGHLDGAVLLFTFESEDGSARTSRRLFQHSCVPYALSWGEHIAAAGQDCIVSFYDRSGHSMQSFDYKQTEDKEVTAVAFNPAGQTLAVACADKLRLFNFNLRSRKWEEGAVTPMHNSYSIPVLAWKGDGSRLTTGTITGAVDNFDASILVGHTTATLFCCNEVECMMMCDASVILNRTSHSVVGHTCDGLLEWDNVGLVPMQPTTTARELK